MMACVAIPAKILKRKRSSSPTSSETTPESTQLGSSDDLEESSRDSWNSNDASGSTDSGPAKKKKKRRVQFDGVTVFYFRRTQGFTCVPSQGGATLGMSNSHENISKFSLNGYAQEQERVHRELLRDQIRLRRMHRKAMREETDGSCEDEEGPNTDDELENVNTNDYYFLQPVPTKKRRVILRSAGVRKIDSTEKRDCKLIRFSREGCGCDCKVYCDPETCSCSLAGIKCQVDRLSFPCGCSKDGCGNLQGRIEFNPIRVRTHFIHTIMRLEMESQQNGLENANEVHENAGDENGVREEESFNQDACTSINSTSIAQSDFSKGGDYADNNSHNQFSLDDDQPSYNHPYHAEDTAYRIPAGPTLYPPEENVQVEISSQQNDALPRVLHFNDCDEDSDNIHSTYNVNLPSINYNSSSSSGSSSSSSEDSLSDSSSQDSYSFDSGQNYNYRLESPLELGTFDESANQELCMVGSTSSHNNNFNNPSDSGAPRSYVDLMSSSSSCDVTSQSQQCNISGYNEAMMDMANNVISENPNYSGVSSTHSVSETYNSHGPDTSTYDAANFTNLVTNDCSNDIYTSTAPSRGDIFSHCESTHNVSSSHNMYDSSSRGRENFQSAPGVGEMVSISSSEGNICSSQTEQKGELYGGYARENLSPSPNESYVTLTPAQQNVCGDRNKQGNGCMSHDDMFGGASQITVGSSEDDPNSENVAISDGHLELVSTSSEVCQAKVSVEISSTEKSALEAVHAGSTDECSNTLQPIQNSDSEGDVGAETDYRHESSFGGEVIDHQNFGEAIKNSLIETVDVSV